MDVMMREEKVEDYRREEHLYTLLGGTSIKYYANTFPTLPNPGVGFRYSMRV